MAQSCLHEDPVFIHEGNDVRNRSDSHEVEEVAEVNSIDRMSLLHRMAELEDNAGTAEVVKVLSKLGIDQGSTERAHSLSFGFVVVEDEEFTALLPELLCLFSGVGTAVDGHNKARHVLPEAASDTLEA